MHFQCFIALHIRFSNRNSEEMDLHFCIMYWVYYSTMESLYVIRESAILAPEAQMGASAIIHWSLYPVVRIIEESRLEEASSDHLVRPAQIGAHFKVRPRPFPAKFWKSPETQISQHRWATCSGAEPPSLWLFFFLLTNHNFLSCKLCPLCLLYNQN